MAAKRKASSSKSAKALRPSKASRSPKATKAPAMDLKAIEKELNSDAGAQAAFIKNPGKFMEDRGLKLRAADKAQLNGLARELLSGPRLPPGSDVVSLSPTITISIRRRIGRVTESDRT